MNVSTAVMIAVITTVVALSHFFDGLVFSSSTSSARESTFVSVFFLRHCQTFQREGELVNAFSELLLLIQSPADVADLFFHVRLLFKHGIVRILGHRSNPPHFARRNGRNARPGYF